MKKVIILIGAGNVIELNEKFLLVQEKEVKIQKGLKGKWNLAAGRLDAGESVISCAKREGREETGFSLEPEYLIGIYQQIQAPINLILFVFKSEIIKGELSVPEDLLAVEWFSLEEIKNLNKKGSLISPYVLKSIEDYKSGKKIPSGYITIFTQSP